MKTASPSPIDASPVQHKRRVTGKADNVYDAFHRLLAKAERTLARQDKVPLNLPKQEADGFHTHDNARKSPALGEQTRQVTKDDPRSEKEPMDATGETQPATVGPLTALISFDVARKSVERPNETTQHSTSKRVAAAVESKAVDTSRAFSPLGTDVIPNDDHTPVASGDSEPVRLSRDPSPWSNVIARDTEAGTETAKSAPHRNDAPTLRAEVLSQQHFPAPVPAPQSSTGAALGIVLAENLKDIRPTPSAFQALLPASPPATSAHVLKIELHPAELGTVTASLRFVGEQLSIELRVETRDAYHRLSNDSDDIVRVLQKIGYDIDKVTVLQPQTAVMPAARSETTPSQTGLSSRDQSTAFGSGQGSNGGGSGGQRPGKDPNHEASASHNAPSHRRGGSDRGLVI